MEGKNKKHFCLEKNAFFVGIFSKSHNFCLKKNTFFTEFLVTRELLVTPNVQIMFFFDENFTCKYFCTKNNENEVEKFL